MFIYIISSLENLEASAISIKDKSSALNCFFTLVSALSGVILPINLNWILFLGLSAFEQDYPTYIFRKNYSNFIVDTRNRSNKEIALEFFSKLEDINLTP